MNRATLFDTSRPKSKWNGDYGYIVETSIAPRTDRGARYRYLCTSMKTRAPSGRKSTQMDIGRMHHLDDCILLVEQVEQIIRAGQFYEYDEWPTTIIRDIEKEIRIHRGFAPGNYPKNEIPGKQVKKILEGIRDLYNLDANESRKSTSVTTSDPRAAMPADPPGGFDNHNTDDDEDEFDDISADFMEGFALAMTINKYGADEVCDLIKKYKRG